MGRRRELGVILDAIALQADAGLVLSATSGIGKTRLAMEAQRQAATRGWQTEWLVATASAASVQFGAFAHLLSFTGGQAESRVEVMSNALAQLTRRSQQCGRLLLGVDDAHLLDDASAALLHQVASRRVAFVLATVRSDLLAPDAVFSLWKDGLTARLELQRLTPADVESLLRQVLPGHVEGHTLHRLERLSEGNLLFLRELVEGYQASDALTCGRGVWRLRHDAPPPGRLMDLIQHRFRDLGREEHEALELLAKGEPLTLEVLGLLVDLQLVERLERGGFVRVAHDSHLIYRIAHPLYAEVFRRETPDLRGREIARNLVAAHRLIGANRGDDVLRLACWSLDAGMDRLDADLLLRAAREAHNRFDLPLALRLAREAREAGAGIPAALVQVRALLGLGRTGEMEDVIEAAAGEEGSEFDRAALVQLRAWDLFRAQGRLDDATRLLTEASSAIDRTEVAATLAVTMADFAVDSGSVRQVLHLTRSVLSASDPPASAAAEALHLSAVAHAMDGSIEEALAENDRAREMASAAVDSHPELLFNIESARSRLLRLQDLDSAEEHCLARYRAAISRPVPFGAANLARTLGWLAMDRGRLSTARRWLFEATQTLSGSQRAGGVPGCARHDRARDGGIEVESGRAHNRLLRLRAPGLRPARR